MGVRRRRIECVRGRPSGERHFPAAATTYAYERRGLLRSEQPTLGGASYTMTNKYDANANRTSIVDPFGGASTYTYDSANRPVAMASVITAAAYLPFGPLTSLTYVNGTTKTMAYDARYRVTENTLTKGTATIADYTYAEDSVGNITQIHDATDATYNRDFAYDDLNRLVTANGGTSLWGSGSYAYDAMGNITSRSLGTAPVDDGTVLSDPRHRAAVKTTGVVDKLAFTYTSTTPMVSVATTAGIDHTVTYDAAGNETQYFAARTYSPRNLLATVTDSSGEGTPHTLTYGYDARGVRVSRTESPTASGSSNRYYFYTPELQLLAITDDDSTNVWSSSRVRTLSAPLAPNREFGYFNGIPVAEFGPARTPDSNVSLSLARRATPSAVATTLYYTFTDHLGTPILQTDSSGAIAWRAEHEPYGNVWKMRTGARTDQPLRLPGQDLAMTWEGTEENYNVFRWYRAGWGRYTQGDPDRLNAPFHPYDYANDNPSRWTDPRGLKAFNMFEPPNIPSMPGQLPNKKCCAQDAIQKSMDSVDYQIDRMINGQTPYGKVVAATISPIQCNNGVCSNEPVDPKSYVFNKGYSKDPCVNYCINFHEFIHYTDTRLWDMSWTSNQIIRFQEFPAYVGEKACLMQFGGK